MAAPFVHLDRTVKGTGPEALLKASFDGNLGLLKDIVKSWNGGPTAIFSVSKDGFNVLHLAACAGHVEACKYLVEELGGDVNALAGGTIALGATPFMISAHSGDVPTVKYLLDHGGDLMKADEKGRTVLHHAVAMGCCKVTEFLLSKGAPVDIDCGRGTPLYHAATNEQDKTLKILLDHHANANTIVSDFLTPLHSALIYRSLKCMKVLIKAGADVNGKGCALSLTPLCFATLQGGYTNFVQFLLKAGADPNIPDDVIPVLNLAVDGMVRSHAVPFHDLIKCTHTTNTKMFAVELAALRDCKEEVEMLFPLTSPIPNVQNWSIDGVIAYAKAEDKKPVDQKLLERRRIMLKSHADMAFKQKEHEMALKCYDMAISHGQSAALFANRSLCKLLLGDGEGALLDALRSRTLRPEWAKACYRQAAAHMLLKEYKQVCDALLDAQKLDPGNDDIKRELRRATELMKNPRGK